MREFYGIEVPDGITPNLVTLDVLRRLGDSDSLVLEFDDSPDDQTAVDQITEIMGYVGGIVSIPLASGDPRHFFVVTLD